MIGLNNDPKAGEDVQYLEMHILYTAWFRTAANNCITFYYMLTLQEIHVMQHTSTVSI